MKTVTFMNRQRGNVNNDNVLHIEVPGAIINVRIGLGDNDGRRVTRIEITADDYSDEEWRIENGDEMLKYLSARIIETPGIKVKESQSAHDIAEKLKVEASHMVKVDPEFEFNNDDPHRKGSEIPYTINIPANLFQGLVNKHKDMKMATENNNPIDPTLEQCVKDFIHDFNQFIGIHGTHGSLTLRNLSLETVKDMTVWFSSNDTQPHWLNRRLIINDVVNGLLILNELDFFKDEPLFGNVVLAAQRMQDSLAYFEAPEIEPVNELEKLLKDTLTHLMGDAAEAINNMVEDETPGDTYWDGAEDARFDLVNRIRKFLEEDFKQSAIVVVEDGVADLEFVPTWMSVEIKDRDGDIACPECDEGMHDEDGPCPNCGWCVEDDEDQDDEG